MNKTDNYKELFNENFLMGPNSLRLLDEMLEKYPIENGLRILDLGCGKGLTSLFLAKEMNAQVFATDLWCSATDNFKLFKEWGVSDSVIPIHADANDLPFANEYFDIVVSIDSFHYFANQPHFFEEKILPLLKPSGTAIIAMPGLKTEIHGSEPQLILDWINGEESEYELFHSLEWWKEHIGKSNGFEIIKSLELSNLGSAWNDWFLTKHPLSIRDSEYFKLGVDKYLAMVGFVIKRI
ncbi:SAM-dependent methyltransferase [Anaerosporobacter sp.]